MKTKLNIPPVLPGLVPRPRLTERLNESASSKLTLISAPAGFDKTTLLSDWIRGSGLHTRVAWLSLGVEDNDPARFLAYVITSLQNFDEKLGASALADAPGPATAAGADDPDDFGQ